eukprot:TRINITY_DN48797_c0_g1_i1.p1 TRINITY_DN48797_c0_g1~~TRINITY_DN48797_c0_g1_i1.p1  ORF type:complete len:437 (-),score=47.44 TRINITY_DN48797_c0_g1_i1:177-1487(-)
MSFEDFVHTSNAIIGGVPLDRQFLSDVWKGAEGQLNRAVNQLLGLPESDLIREAGSADFSRYADDQGAVHGGNESSLEALDGFTSAELGRDAGYNSQQQLVEQQQGPLPSICELKDQMTLFVDNAVTGDLLATVVLTPEACGAMLCDAAEKASGKKLLISVGGKTLDKETSLQANGLSDGEHVKACIHRDIPDNMQCLRCQQFTANPSQKYLCSVCFREHGATYLDGQEEELLDAFLLALKGRYDGRSIDLESLADGALFCADIKLRVRCLELGKPITYDPDGVECKLIVKGPKELRRPWGLVDTAQFYVVSKADSRLLHEGTKQLQENHTRRLPEGWDPKFPHGLSLRDPGAAGPGSDDHNNPSTREAYKIDFSDCGSHSGIMKDTDFIEFYISKKAMYPLWKLIWGRSLPFGSPPARRDTVQEDYVLLDKLGAP